MLGGVSGGKREEIKVYLEKNRVLEVLRKGLKRLYREQPEAPI